MMDYAQFVFALVGMLIGVGDRNQAPIEATLPARAGKAERKSGNRNLQSATR